MGKIKDAHKSVHASTIADFRDDLMEIGTCLMNEVGGWFEVKWSLGERIESLEDEIEKGLYTTNRERERERERRVAGTRMVSAGRRC